MKKKSVNSACVSRFFCTFAAGNKEKDGKDEEADFPNDAVSCCFNASQLWVLRLFDVAYFYNEITKRG